MNTALLEEMIDTVISDSVIKTDVTRKIAEANRPIEIDGRILDIPKNPNLVIVTKAFFKEYFDVGFGAIRVEVAVGHITNEKFGVLDAEYCFATLYYDQEVQLITIDFHEEMR